MGDWSGAEAAYREGENDVQYYVITGESADLLPAHGLPVVPQLGECRFEGGNECVPFAGFQIVLAADSSIR